jgi:hypothetical protein
MAQHSCHVGRADPISDRAAPLRMARHVGLWRHAPWRQGQRWPMASMGGCLGPRLGEGPESRLSFDIGWRKKAQDCLWVSSDMTQGRSMIDPLGDARPIESPVSFACRLVWLPRALSSWTVDRSDGAAPSPIRSVGAASSRQSPTHALSPVSPWGHDLIHSLTIHLIYDLISYLGFYFYINSFTIIGATMPKQVFGATKKKKARKSVCQALKHSCRCNHCNLILFKVIKLVWSILYYTFLFFYCKYNYL